MFFRRFTFCLLLLGLNSSVGAESLREFFEKAKRENLIVSFQYRAGCAESMLFGWPPPAEFKGGVVGDFDVTIFAKAPYVWVYDDYRGYSARFDRIVPGSLSTRPRPPEKPILTTEQERILSFLKGIKERKRNTSFQVRIPDSTLAQALLLHRRDYVYIDGFAPSLDGKTYMVKYHTDDFDNGVVRGAVRLDAIVPESIP
jgi:hypothetical protein